MEWTINFLIYNILLQRIRSVVDEKEQRQMLMELDAVMRSNDCPYIVQFYGALFKEVRSSLLLPLSSLNQN